MKTSKTSPGAAMVDSSSARDLPLSGGPTTFADTTTNAWKLIVADGKDLRNYWDILPARFKQQVRHSEWDYLTTVAIRNSETVGLVVVRLDRRELTASLACLYVTPPNRRIGIGTVLLRAACTRARQAGVAKVALTLVANSVHTGIRSFLKKNGWPALECCGLSCVTDYRLISNAKWMRARRLPPAATVFGWSTLTAEDRVSLSSESTPVPWYPRILDPLEREDQIDYGTSIGLRCSGTIAGWCVFRTGSNPETAVCSSLYVRTDLQARGYGIALAAAALALHSNAPDRRIIFDVALDNAPMLRFLRRGIAPHLRSLTVIRRSTKMLGDDALVTC